MPGTTIEIPCISLWQPWAQFIALGWKTIETRTHERFASLVGKRIGIHAAERWDKNWQALAGPWLTGQQIEIVNRRKVDWPFWRGVVVCTATVDMHKPLNYGDSQSALIDCSYSFDGEIIPRRYGLLLSNVKETTFPQIRTAGKQGIFYVPESICA
jgi:hypothetical protein